VISRFDMLYRSFRGEILAIPGRAIAVVFGLLLLSIPVITQDPYLIGVLIMTNIYVIYAAAWDLLSGFTGQMNLGHAFSFGVAAYAAALLNIHLGLAPWATIPIAGVLAALAGTLLSLPALKLRGPFLALVTLAFPLIATGLVYVFGDFTGAELGVSGISPLFDSCILDYYIVLAIMIVSLVVMWKLTDSGAKIVRTGIIFRAIREDEIAARTSGVNTTKYKVLAFAISGVFAGIAGGLYAHSIQVVGPSTLELLLSFQAIIWTVFGGIGTIYGPVVGVYILYPALQFLGSFAQYRMLIFAVLIILILLFMPIGIGAWVRDKIEKTCPRCRLVNATTRKYCRGCGAILEPEKVKIDKT